jgi:protein involved in polysaccharide export with SLBB domain
MEYRNRRYSIMGAIAAPGSYPVTGYDMKLFEALSQAGGVQPFHEQHFTVVRRMTEDELSELIARAWAEETAEQEVGVGPEAPEVGEPPAEPEAADEGEPAAEKAPLTDTEELQAVAEGRVPTVTVPEETPPAEPVAPAPAEVAPPAAPPSDDAPAGEWTWKEGRWVRVEPPEVKEPEGPDAEDQDEAPEFTGRFEDLPRALRERLMRLGVIQAGDGLKRIIRIDVEALLAGDETQNIVLRNADQVHLPEPPAGEWYIDGEIVRRGVYSLTGRKITLLQAVAAAGGLTQLAIPWRTELVRRVSDDAEEIIYVDLAKIARGEAPDFYLQPDDLIRIGTDQGAIFLAVLRNAFRATYGFGLVYDQNFADIYPWKGGIHPLFGN